MTDLIAPPTATGSTREWVRARPLVSFFFLAYALIFAAYFIYLAIPDLPYIPFWFVGVFSPTIAAVALSGLIGGTGEIKRLFSGFARWRIGWKWYLAASMTLLLPLLLAVGYIAFGNRPEGLVAGTTAWILIGHLVFTFLSGPLSEETGWRGYALPRLQERYSALTSSLILGVVWTFWHVPIYFLPDATMIPLPMFLPMTVALTILFTWVYNNTGGSLVATVLMHFFFNFSGAFLAGHLGLMPPMLLYVGGGITLGALTVVVVARYGKEKLSLKPAGQMPIRSSDV